jgi:uncharacterized membrane protein
MRLSRKRKAIAAGVALLGVAAVAVATSVSLAMADHAVVDYSGTNAMAKSSCKITALDGPKGNKEGSVEAVSPSGEYLVGEADGKTGVWHDDEFTALGKADLSAVDVNDDGVVAGSGDDGSDREGPWVWSDGKFTNLEPPKGATNAKANVTGISADGDVIGNAGTYVDDQSQTADPLLWKMGETKPAKLKKTKKEASANDISADGTIVGSQQNGENGTVVPWVWKGDGAGKRLPKIPGDDGDDLEATKISGDFVTARGGDDFTDTYVWNLSDGTSSKKPFTMTDPTGVSDTGKLVYGALIADIESDWDTSYAVIETAKGIEQLPLLVDEEDLGNNTNGVMSASQDGSLLAGDAWDKTTKHKRAVVWTGCSDPS